jgi:hypothetical protein
VKSICCLFFIEDDGDTGIEVLAEKGGRDVAADIVSILRKTGAAVATLEAETLLTNGRAH